MGLTSPNPAEGSHLPARCSRGCKEECEHIRLNPRVLGRFTAGEDQLLPAMHPAQQISLAAGCSPKLGDVAGPAECLGDLVLIFTAASAHSVTPQAESCARRHMACAAVRRPLAIRQALRTAQESAAVSHRPCGAPPVGGKPGLRPNRQRNLLIDSVGKSLRPSSSISILM